MKLGPTLGRSGRSGGVGEVGEGLEKQKKRGKGKKEEVSHTEGINNPLMFSTHFSVHFHGAQQV